MPGLALSKLPSVRLPCVTPQETGGSCQPDTPSPAGGPGGGGQVNGRACLVSGAPGTWEGDCRLSLDKIGECLVDPSQRGSIVHYQCGHRSEVQAGEVGHRDGLGA